MSMILSINGRSVIFSKFFSASDGEKVLEAVAAKGASRVLFVDTGATPVLVNTIFALVEREVEVVVRDHHRGEGRTPQAAEAIETMLGDNARIVTRQEAPGCALLVKLGEFSQDGDMIVADTDLDGLTAAMKAAGLTYEGLDSDAEVLDVRPKQSAETLTPLAWTACRSLGTLPPFNPKAPERAEEAKMELYGAIVAASQGDEEALAALESRVRVYETQVEEAKRLLQTEVSEPCSGVVMANVVGSARHDLSTLTRGLEAKGAIVTVVCKDFGPIAGSPGGHGLQYSLAVVRRHQGELDLRDLVPEGAETSPKAGLLSNTSFLLHCSEEVWEETVLPALVARLS